MMAKERTEDTGHRDESYEVKSVPANQTKFEASYEYASGNETNKRKKTDV